MPRRSKILALPAAVKKWLDGALIDGNFSGYEELAAELKGRGFDISKSGLHRYGSSFDDRLRALKLVTEQAKAVVQAAPDEEDAVTEALVRLTQEKLFTVVMDLNVDPEIYERALPPGSVAEGRGVREFLRRVSEAVPGIAYGYFNPTKERYAEIAAARTALAR